MRLYKSVHLNLSLEATKTQLVFLYVCYDFVFLFCIVLHWCVDHNPFSFPVGGKENTIMEEREQILSVCLLFNPRVSIKIGFDTISLNVPYLCLLILAQSLCRICKMTL